MIDDDEKKRSVKYQYFASIVVNLLTFGLGLVEGWCSPSLLLLTSDETHLAAKITMEEASWIASLLYVGSMIGSIFFGYVINNFGRKLPLMIISLPMIVCWLLIWFGENLYYYYAARILGGFFGGSGFMIVPIFLSEISDDSIRGTLVSMLVLSETAGILSAFIIATYFDYYAIPKFAIAVIVLYAMALHFLPESSLFLMKQNRLKEAERSIRFYKNMRYSNEDRKQIDLEIRKLTVILDGQSTNNAENSFKWTDITTGIGRKAFLMGIILVGINVFSGAFFMTAYTANIFEETGSNLSPNVSAIIVGSIQLLGAGVATQFVDRCGRKLLLLISTLGTALGLITLGSFMMFKSLNFEIEAFNWIPVASFSWSVFVSTMGIQTITLTVVVEIMPQKIKDACVSVCMTLLFLFAFINVKFLPSLIEAVGFSGSMFLFAGVCVGGSIFIFLFLPETKGKSPQEIMKALE